MHAVRGSFLHAANVSFIHAGSWLKVHQGLKASDKRATCALGKCLWAMTKLFESFREERLQCQQQALQVNASAHDSLWSWAAGEEG